MATNKVTFSKLALKKQDEVKIYKYNDFEIEVKQYLSVDEKLKLIERVLRNSSDSNNFINPLKVDVVGTLEIIFAYTNINFTDKQKEDIPKIYDLLETNGLIDNIISYIPEKEYELLIESIDATVKAYHEYENSVMGILERVSTDYSQLDFDAAGIQEKLADPANLTLLKDVMTKLG